ncbi:MAG TPA: DUF222 domain-containing protein [Nocardioides sp.]|nr:DUF222 domain-containing protein [Nocardioides sp.]
MASPTALQQIGTAVESAAQLAQVSWSGLEDGEALAAAVELGRLRSVIDGALVGVGERLEATGATGAAGWASTKDFLTHVLGGRKGAGASVLRVAKQTAEHPEVRTALAAGDLSLAQASAIGSRVATLPHVPALRSAAANRMLGLVEDHSFDATDLDRSFLGVVKELDPDGRLLGSDLAKTRQERGAHRARFLSFSPDTLGGVRIRGYATIEDAELVTTTLMPLAAPLTTEPGACGGDPDPMRRRDEHGHRISHGCPDPDCFHDGKDHRESGTRMWDALVESCRLLQATEHLPHAHGTTARITVTTTYHALLDQLAQAQEGLLPSGDSLSAAAVRKLACDAEIIPAVLGTPSQVLDVGRTNRLVTTGIWSALVLRDRHCAFPGCTRLPIACDAHHVLHWADGGPTSLDNLVLLCRKHHTVAHQTPWQVQIDPTTRRPTWIPPPPVDDRDRFSYHPASRPPPHAA